MEEALGNDMILENIAEFLPLRELLNARLVNRFWAKSVNRTLRQRCVHIDAFDTIQACEIFLNEEGDLPNQELVARVPWRIDMSCEVEALAGSILFQSLDNSRLEWMSWFHVISLTGVSIDGANQWLTLLLHRFPCLENLSLDFDEPWRPRGGNLENWSLSSQTNEVPSMEPPRFPLKRLVLIFGSETEEPSLNASFLKHCRQLKTFRVELHGSPEQFSKFYESWEKLVYTPSLQYNTVNVVIPSHHGWRTSNQKFHERFFRTLANFISMVRPKSLTLMNFELQELVERSPFRSERNQWTAEASKIQEATVESLHVIYADATDLLGDSYPNCLLRQLKKLMVFSQVTRLYLSSGLIPIKEQAWRDYEKPGLQCTETHRSQTARDVNNFDKVTSLVIADEVVPDLHNCFGKIASHLPNLTNLTIDYVCFQMDENFDGVFESSQLFPALRDLSVSFLDCRVREMLPEDRRNGYFGNMGAVTGLKKFTLKEVEFHPMIPKTYLLVLLFSGYEPHVNLELEASAYTGERFGDVFHLQLSVDEFKNAMIDAEANRQVDEEFMRGNKAAILGMVLEGW